ncbi:nuclear transcription factor Y subunit gamma [Elysia marginata]|uniref:Nuclear transcription factor Y subunit gamma n=1 Tax=Elysia marginata TaxID=1093978 RepID=A0AAV4H1F3_9GAST|nr:nuclear transcription factor Y subunit gamma [Elysia marginata]
MAGSEVNQDHDLDLGLDLEVGIEPEGNDLEGDTTNLGNQENQAGDAVVHDELRSESEPQEKLIKLPLSRIRGIMKTDPDVKIASHDAVIILAKAAELFIQSVSRDAAERTIRDKKKTVLRKHLGMELTAWYSNFKKEKCGYSD